MPLAKELRDSFENRALLYWHIYDELETELGPERAERTPDAVADRFLAASPDQGRLFPTEIVRRDGEVHIKVTSCPLKDAWAEADLHAQDLAAICRIAGRFDNGLFGACGIRFAADTWQPGSTGCCHLHLRP